MTGTLGDGLCTFMIISPAFLLGMRKFRAKVVEKIKTHILCSVPSPPPKIVPFMR